MDPDVKKQTIRRLALARRARLSPLERETHATTLVQRLLSLEEVAAAPSVLAFASISSEVSTTSLLRAVLEAGKTLFLPFVTDAGAMEAAAVNSLDELEPGYRGIPEPATKVPVPASSAGVVVVPGVAFDQRGGRLGYGGGFYDRFLAAAVGVTRIGICFETQIVDELPMLEHDQGVDIVVTEERTIRCR